MPLLTQIISTAKDSSEPLTANGVVELTYLQLSFLLLSLAVVVFTSQRLSLDIETQLGVGALRCFVQLSALGLVLVPIIKYNNPPLVLAYIVFMMFIAAIEASSRPPYIFDALFIVCFVCIATTVSLFALFTFSIIVPVGLDAQYVIPVVGMIAGNSMSAVSVAVSAIVTNLAEHKHDVELLLAMGATRWEASMNVVKSGIKLGLTPTLNTMSVAGLVAIPGMMTGQIIGGTPPSTAAKYQLVIIENRIRTEKLSHRDSASRIGSMLSSGRYIARTFWNWRSQSLQMGSPFPSHVQESSPSSYSEAPPKTEGDEANYGSIKTR
ncbi:unnamed protein product [Agarophyton chilense]